MRIINVFERLRLQSKFILITTLAIILLMGILGYVSVEHDRALLYREVERQSKQLGETLAIPILNDLIYERLGLVEEGGLRDNYIMEIFNRHDLDILYLVVIDKDGRVISHNDITEYGKIYSDPLTEKAFSSENTIIQRFASKGHAALDIGVPLSIGKKRWGTLKIGVSLEEVENKVIATIHEIVLLTLVLVAIGFSLILLLTRGFINPITQLARTMEQTGCENLDVKVNVKGHDELAMLGERFNSMIERLQQAREELMKTDEKLIQSAKLASIGTLASGVAHEINNPLAGLFNCVEMLKQNDGNPELRERYLGLIKEGLDRIEITVSKLLWMPRKSEHALRDVNVLDAVDSIYPFLEFKLQKDNVKFVNEIPHDLQVTVDLHDFQQMMMNLMINAVQAMQNGGRLTVRGHQDDGSIKIDVLDTGTGIAPEDVGSIFDPFFTTKPTGEGTGLGLWLTYVIMKNYNGELTVESEMGKGSRFTLSFPAAVKG
ncbi:MAG: ATP-binding protein [Nitrospirae bacterium]|nr:ATP-binding protein [Nitrospirota bacterium]